MTSFISSLCVARGVNVCGYTALGLGGLSYVTQGVLSITATKTAEAFARFCPNAGEPVSTGLGNMTCSSLESLVNAESVLVPLFAWTVPIVACVASAFIAYQVTHGGCSCKRRDYTEITNTGLPVDFEEEY